MFTNIAIDWDSNRGSLSSEKINIHYQNLGSILEMVIIIEGLKTGLGQEYVILGIDESTLICDIESLQKKMKEALEKMQQQQSASMQKKLEMQQQNEARQEELEKKIEEKFRKYIENGIIDAVSIASYENSNFLYTKIKLKDDNKNTDIRVSEFLNSEFCKENNIAGFLLSSGDQKEVVHGFVDENGVRCYSLGTTAQYGIKFNWYVDGKEFSITLGANSDGSIRVIGDRPTDKDLEENKDVRIKVGNDYLSLADAVKTCKQEKNEASSKLSQPSTTEYFRPVQTPA
ncbi:hypothetical protein [Wolbachia endosymbiont (group B) of Philonthus cognatus]|uniref:hypothetical protein n=1 Tax=Wolbachia endosymbiont (group B) of Philonthus cognatus TaxID=2954047 RepID=UPI0022202A86|nr:hypothetical protein [Wolbachia endosymbiont (group B) of Philonthus cognatus]